MTFADLVREGFAFAYTETSNGAPMSMRTQATCLAIQEAEAFPPDLILEAARTEGHRDAREAQHIALYDYHSANMAKAVAPILGRLDHAEIARQAVDHAQQQAQAGSDPVMRRRAVVSLVLGALTAHVHADDRKTLDDLNADGWAHATAQGQAEAQATPAKGGPPDTKLVTGLAITALAQITRGGGALTASTWTDEQLRSIAMGVALAAGDGSALGEATRKVTAALTDTGRATMTYANQLHQAVNAAYVQQINAATPDALFDWAVAADPCDDCTDNQLNSPYAWADIPMCPAHPNCQCNVEQSTSVLSLASA